MGGQFGGATGRFKSFWVGVESVRMTTFYNNKKCDMVKSFISVLVKQLISVFTTMRNLQTIRKRSNSHGPKVSS